MWGEGRQEVCWERESNGIGELWLHQIQRELILHDHPQKLVQK